ncbi:MAG: hypothetical protein GAK31_00343 [Stenotrophomonas maltophilia]|uniref:Carbohydrate kinase PfkB domain-containing protein n=1 Tax=Stenotrophomonas maltophilia TaxID=40324 RepID=A0A7V8JN44_STEMA|nr:MAG: hypothetical protein GAK31_00343 [Stenotrophomonas maltophilia]
MSNDQPQFSIIGDVSVDLVLGTLDAWPRHGTEQLMPRSELRAGGSAANSALAARHLGLSPRLIGAIGEDDLAQWLQLQLAGISVELQTCPSDTTMSVGLLHHDGERTFFTSCGHLQQLSPAFVRGHLPRPHRAASPCSPPRSCCRACVPSTAHCWPMRPARATRSRWTPAGRRRAGRRRCVTRWRRGLPTATT